MISKTLSLRLYHASLKLNPRRKRTRATVTDRVRLVTRTGTIRGMRLFVAAEKVARVLLRAVNALLQHKQNLLQRRDVRLPRHLAP